MYNSAVYLGGSLRCGTASHYRFAYQSGAAVPPENGLVADQDYPPFCMFLPWRPSTKSGACTMNRHGSPPKPTDAIRTLSNI